MEPGSHGSVSGPPEQNQHQPQHYERPPALSPYPPFYDPLPAHAHAYPAFLPALSPNYLPDALPAFAPPPFPPLGFHNAHALPASHHSRIPHPYPTPAHVQPRPLVPAPPPPPPAFTPPVPPPIVSPPAEQRLDRVEGMFPLPPSEHSSAASPVHQAPPHQAAPTAFVAQPPAFVAPPPAPLVHPSPAPTPPLPTTDRHGGELSHSGTLAWMNGLAAIFTKRNLGKGPTEENWTVWETEVKAQMKAMDPLARSIFAGARRPRVGDPEALAYDAAALRLRTFFMIAASEAFAPFADLPGEDVFPRLRKRFHLASSGSQRFVDFGAL
ncbi:hypothetical protein JCM5296_001251 [Sporobolomyces johnsonii]